MTSPIALGGRCILVTGGSMGIGLAVAKECLRAGGRVGICSRTLADLDIAVASLKQSGYSDIAGFRCDVTQQGELEGALDDLETRFGPLRAVVHAAGILGPIGPLTEVDPAMWLEAVTTNLFGSFLVVRQAGQRMALHGGGRIVLFSGGGASGPFPNYSGYACGKVAVVRLTETAAIELAALNVEVNCVAPGFVITRLHDQTLAAGESAGDDYLELTKAQIERGGEPATTGARAATYLISERAAGITGKFVSAVYDDFESWPSHLAELDGSDLFTLRRVVPRDRGMHWQ